MTHEIAGEDVVTNYNTSAWLFDTDAFIPMMIKCCVSSMAAKPSQPDGRCVYIQGPPVGLCNVFFYVNLYGAYTMFAL